LDKRDLHEFMEGRRFSGGLVPKLAEFLFWGSLERLMLEDIHLGRREAKVPLCHLSSPWIPEG